ncbi:hypothetical protein MMC27_002023 [Xylographa pallens]|nr:hypothetical protein [Xylographa pallens]
MPHPMQSHKSEEGLMRKFFSVDITKVAVRTSSVRLKRRQRPADVESKRSSMQPGYHLITSRRTSDLIDVETGIRHPRTPSRLKIRKPPGSAVSPPEQDIEDPDVRTRPGYRYDGLKHSLYDSGTAHSRNGLGTTMTANRTYKSMKLDKQDSKCVVRKESSTKRTLTHDSNGVARDAPHNSSTIARTTTDKQIGVQITSAEELQQEGWRLVRAAMQVEMDPVQDDCGDGPILHDSHGPGRTWKHAERNFFPSGSQHLDAEDVVRAVLEKHVKAARFH